MMSRSRRELMMRVDGQLCQVQLLLSHVSRLVRFWEPCEAADSLSSGHDPDGVLPPDHVAFDFSRDLDVLALRWVTESWSAQAEEVCRSHANPPAYAQADADMAEAELNTAGLIIVLSQLAQGLTASFRAGASLAPDKIAILRSHVDRWRKEACGLAERLQRERADTGRREDMDAVSDTVL